MVKTLCLIAVFSLGAFLVPAIAANALEPTACADRSRCPDIHWRSLQGIRQGAYSRWRITSVCSYLGRGENFQDMLMASRGLDVTLNFLDTADATAQMYENSLDQYRLRANSPDLP